MSPARPRDEPLIVGRLQEHGTAPYQFRSGQEVSYFVRLLTQGGERVLWGKDLERALGYSETKPQVGDVVGARRVGREAVTVTARQRDADGQVVRQSDQVAHRYRWVVEKVALFAERARLARRVRDSQADAREEVRNRPELLSTYLTIRGAEQVAAKSIADPEDRKRFVELVREAMAASIKQGEPLPSVHLKDKVKSDPPKPPPARPQSRDDAKTR